MRNKTLLSATAFILVFGIAIAYLLVSQLNQPPENAVKSIPSQPLQITGRLSVVAIEDLRVAGRRIRLCGVAFTRSSQLRPLVLETMKREFQERTIVCKQVGAGTPCDGRSAPIFQRTPVMQCFDGEMDLAQALADRKLLCDVPALSGGHYTSC